MTGHLRVLAAAFLARLALILIPIGEPRALVLPTVLVFALVTSWVPWRSLGLPGDYTPMTGGMP